MNLKREVIIAALLATMLGIGLGFASYSLVSESPRKTVLRVIDVHTQRGGLGAGELGGIFGPNEFVQLSAYSTADGLPINQTEVTFTIKNPNEDETESSAITDDSGIAEINLKLPNNESAIGNWTVTATANVENETISDSLLFECRIASTPIVTVKALDLYTQQGGLGINGLGGAFGPGEVVQLFAYLTGNGLPINQTEVAFTICQYSGNATTESALTDDVGIARINFTLPSGSSSEGNWSVSAIAHVENETVSDFLFFGCGIIKASMLVVTKRNGNLTVNFNPKDYVTVDTHVYCENDSLPAQLWLDVMLPNRSYFLQQPITTDVFGNATTEFQIPWPGNVFGTWQIHVSFEVQGSQIEAYAYFDCQPPQIALDVYTQRGGQGQNMHSEAFLLGENVSLAALFNVLNSTVATGKLVSFEVRFNETTVLVLTAQTNSSGIATVSFGIPSDASFAGPWEVYARIDDGVIVLLDTLVFEAELPQG
jgi:hypothetical protein